MVLTQSIPLTAVWFFVTLDDRRELCAATNVLIRVSRVCVIGIDGGLFASETMHQPRVKPDLGGMCFR